jgi:hypothetical protein
VSDESLLVPPAKVNGDGDQKKISEEQLADEKSVFIIMPFSLDFTDVWKGGIQKGQPRLRDLLQSASI